MRHRSIICAATTAAALAAPAVAQAHVSIHPNVVPAGAFATLTLQVPNESDKASTTRIAVRMPPGFLDVSAAPPPGWTFTTKTQKLAKPVQSDDGPITERVTEIDFSGGKLPPGQFVQIPISVVIPGKAGDVLTFKTLQSYSDGKVARWIGTPGSEAPAPTIDVSAKGGVEEDVAGSETGPPASAGQSGSASQGTTQTTPTATRVVEKQSSNGLAIAALIVAILAAILAAASFFARRRAAAR